MDLGHVQQGQRVEVKYGGNVKRILVKAKANTKADVFALSSATTISYRQRSLAEERPVLANGIVRLLLPVLLDIHVQRTARTTTFTSAVTADQ